MARLPLVLLACVFLTSAFAAPVAIISAAAKFRDLTPSDVPNPDESYKWLRYVTNSTWEPANMRWDCSTTPGVCSGNTCGTSSATGPWCRNPTVPSNAPYGLDLDRFPWQVRWGEPAGVGVSNGVGIPSGFGFRGTYNYGANNIYETFWVGEAVHFNNVIYDYGANRWTLVITLFITANSVTTTQDFAYSLRLDETLNDCSDSGCPWQSNWWTSNPTADTRPDCPALTPTPRLPNNGPRCCRYYTIRDRQCADRVWTLDALDQTKSITVNGRPYTLNIKGFSLPNDPSTQKDYFISQERGKTYAEIYGNLVDACPAISSCPPGQRLVVQGTSCVCTCPDNTPCPAGQARNSTCQCNCLPDAVQCNGGTVRTSGSSCVCDCAGASCTAPKVVDSADFCKCKCPANICNAGTVSNPNDPNCPCSCPACPVAGQVADSRCNCTCPTDAATQCTTSGGTYDTATCTCSVPCVCPETACKTLQSCSTGDGICRYNFNVNVSCDAPNADLCLAKCGPAGECVFDAVDCSAQVNLTDKYGATNAQCWSVACNPATGGCVETFHEEQACSLDLTAEGASAPCKTSVCRTVGGVSACIAIPNTAVEGTPCVLPSDDQCNAGACAAGVCVNNPKVLQPCTDGSGCTFLDNFVDPVTSKNTDACLLDPQDPTKAKCTANRTICDRIAVACNSVTCVDTPAGSFCELTPLPYGTACDDGTKCTVNDVCQQELVVDPATGAVVWQANGICEGVSAQCNTDNPCMVGRCIEGGGCEYRADVRQGFICGISEDNCTVFRCDNGTCVASEDVCPAGTSRTGAIIGATIAGAAAILAAAAVALWARSRIASTKVFDPNTWDQLQAGAGDNNPLYHAKTNERVNALYGN